MCRCINGKYSIIQMRQPWNIATVDVCIVDLFIRLKCEYLTNHGSAWIVKTYSLRLFFNPVCNYMHRPTGLKPKVTSLKFFTLSRLHLMDLFRASRSNTFNATIIRKGYQASWLVVAFFPHLHKINREICKRKRRQSYIVSCDMNEWMNEQTNEWIYYCLSKEKYFVLQCCSLRKKIKNKKSDWCKKLFKKLTIYKILNILVKDGI